MFCHQIDGLRRATRAAAVVFLTAAGLAATLGASGADAASYANFNRETYAYSSTLSTAQEAGRYQVMVLQSNQASTAAALKAANPHLKILMYQGIMAAENASPSYVTCTTGPWVLANHSSWILKDQNGRPILYQNHYLLDVGNTAYQQTCLQNVIASVKAGHFDGVYWDMANAKLSWTLPPSGTTVPAYHTDAAWQAAMYSMLTYAGKQMHAQSLMNVANIGGAFLFPGLWQQWNGPLDGAEEESFTDDKQGLVQGLWGWPKQLANVAWSEANHRLVLLHSWNTTHAGNVFGLASALLVAGGETSYSTSNSCYSSCETWYPEYTTAQYLGAPVGPDMVLPNKVTIRWYQNGLVLVNASTSSVGSFSLGGGTYTGSGLTHVGSVSLPATSADILVGDSGAGLSTPTGRSAPTISGHAAVGSTLTASPGSWGGSPAPTFAYQWVRCTTTQRSSCAGISGATGSSYTVQSADHLHYLAVVAIAVNRAGLAMATSAETGQA